MIHHFFNSRDLWVHILFNFLTLHSRDAIKLETAQMEALKLTKKLTHFSLQLQFIGIITNKNTKEMSTLEVRSDLSSLGMLASSSMTHLNVLRFLMYIKKIR